MTAPQPDATHEIAVPVLLQCTLVVGSRLARSLSSGRPKAGPVGLAGTTQYLGLPRQSRPAIEPGEIAIVILRRLGAHDGVADAGVFA
jgi:hypothetical protein